MKFKKVFLSLAIMLGGFLLFNNNVYAKECTDVYYSPEFYHQWPIIRTNKYNLHTASNVCRGDNTEVWFTNHNAWPFNSSDGTGSGRAVYVELYEEDPPGNDDEYVKHYSIAYGYDDYFYTIYTNTITSGNIDSVGDQQCELYLNFYGSGSMWHVVPQSILTYKICMN